MKTKLKLKFQNGPLCPGGLNIPMYSFKSGFRRGETLDFMVESDADPVLIMGTGASVNALRTIEGINGILRAKDDCAYSHRRKSYLLMLFKIDSLPN